GEHHLSALALRRIRSPCVEKIAKFLAEYPAQKLELKLLNLKVLSPLQRRGRPKRIGIGCVEQSLIQITRIGIQADTKISVLGVNHFETEVGSVPAVFFVLIRFL